MNWIHKIANISPLNLPSTQLVFEVPIRVIKKDHPVYGNMRNEVNQMDNVARIYVLIANNSSRKQMNYQIFFNTSFMQKFSYVEIFIMQYIIRIAGYVELPE